MNIDVIQFYDQATRVMMGVAVFVFCVLFVINAPYGRHTSERWGPLVSARVGWVLMEVPAPLFFAIAYLTGEHAFEPLPLFFAVLFQAHYINRSVLYPLMMKSKDKQTTLFIVLSATFFNATNGLLCGMAVGHFGDYGLAWLTDPRFVVGTCLFFGGAAINLHSDSVLRRLRKPGENGYRIPHGGLYRWVSCPNYLGEILEWFGWAIATWSLAGLAFALMTCANLMPRARSNHRWYRETFEDYPDERRALLPRLY